MKNKPHMYINEINALKKKGFNQYTISIFHNIQDYCFLNEENNLDNVNTEKISAFVLKTLSLIDEINEYNRETKCLYKMGVYSGKSMIDKEFKKALLSAICLQAAIGRPLNEDIKNFNLDPFIRELNENIKENVLDLYSIDIVKRPNKFFDKKDNQKIKTL